MTFFKRLFRPAATRDVRINSVTAYERDRFVKSMSGETAVVSAARLGCIAG